MGAVAWRLAYERPMLESLPVFYVDRRRRAWVHTWMIAGVVVTPAGLAGLAVAVDEATATVLTAMSTAVFVSGAVCWLVSLTFRLTVVPWAAERTVTEGHVPGEYAAYDRWAAALYLVHMLTAYVGSAVLGTAVLARTRCRRGSGGPASCGAWPSRWGF